MPDRREIVAIRQKNDEGKWVHLVEGLEAAVNWRHDGRAGVTCIAPKHMRGLGRIHEERNLVHIRWEEVRTVHSPIHEKAPEEVIEYIKMIRERRVAQAAVKPKRSTKGGSTQGKRMTKEDKKMAELLSQLSPEQLKAVLERGGKL